MKPVIVVILLLTCVGVLYTESIRYPIVQAIWRGIDKMNDKTAREAVLPEGVAVHSDIPYISDGLTAHLLDVYHPENVQGQLPVIIYVHGGGFLSGDKRHTKQYSMTLAKEGYVVFNLNYRLAPDYAYPDPIEDVLTAIAWVKENAPAYHGDQSKIVLAGDSAGAYLTALAANICTNPAVAAKLNLPQPLNGHEIAGVLLFSGLYDLETGSTRSFPAIKSDIEMFLGTNDILSYPHLSELSVIKQMTVNYPRTFVSSGSADWLHPETVEFVKALEQNAIPHEAFLTNDKKAFHDFQLQLDLDISKQCMSKVLEFLRDVTS